MSLLAHKEQVAWQTGDAAAATTRSEQQREFLGRHLLAWAPRWTEQLQRDSHEARFVHLAALVRGFLELDRDCLNGGMA
jgi:TorA maturation chaperone TorD